MKGISSFNRGASAAAAVIQVCVPRSENIRFEGIEMAMRESRPNLLLITVDQMRGDCLSVLGHPVVETPNLDQLARGGLLFRNAYTSTPSCVPCDL